MSRPLVSAEVSPFVGRDLDLSELRATLEAAAGGRGDLVLVSGEAGIGKTRLLEELARTAHQSGFAVRTVACRGDEGAPPFWPWARVLGDLVPGERLRDDASLRLLRDEARASAPASVADAEAERWELFDAVSEVLRTAGEQRPLLVAVDDLHWADAASLRLLARLAPDLRGSRVAILAAYRESDATPDLVAALSEIGTSARHLILSGLGREEMSVLVHAVAGSVPSAVLVDALHHRTQGNPLFAREIARLLVAQGRFDDGEHAVALPLTVRAVLERRLARLPTESHSLLVTAAVAGTECSAEMLVLATGRSRADVLAQLGDAIDARLVAATPEKPGSYQFTHPLVREVLYDGLNLPLRVEEHQHVADALTALDAPTSQIAYHLVQAAPGGDVERAVAYTIRAGDEAARELAYEGASNDYRRAIALLPAGDDRRAALLLRAGEVELRAGDLARARCDFLDAAATARLVADGPSLARAALGLGAGSGGFEIGMGDQTQIDLLEEALAALGDEDSVLRAWVTARLSVALTHVDEDRRPLLAEAATAMARRVGDDRALAYALAAHCDVIAGPEHTDARAARSSEIVDLARAAGDRELELLGRRLRLVAVLERGDVVAADAEIDAYERIARTLRQPLYQWYVPLWRGMRALMQGELERWRQHLAVVDVLAEQTGSANAPMLAFTQRMAFATLHDTDFSEVRRELDGLTERYPDLLSYASLFAVVYARTGREAQARALLDSLCTSGLRAIPRDSEWLSTVAGVADATALLEHRELAPILYEHLRPFGGRVIIDGIGGACLGAVDHWLARLALLCARDEEARVHFDDALLIHRSMGATLLVEVTERCRERALGPTSARVAEAEAAFRREGELWTLTYEGHSVGIRDAKGVRDLAVLLAMPGQAVHVTELLGATEGHPAPTAPGSDAVLDRRAVEEYRRRLRELEEEVDDAQADHDTDRAARARAERDALIGELESALGLGGRSRRLGDETERARKAVRARLRWALDRITALHPALGKHLRASVRSGTFCSYEPERLPDWQL